MTLNTPHGFGVAVLLSWILLGGAAQAQTALPVHSPPVAASAEDSRLRQMEAIYQMELRTKHIPLLGDYLTEMQKLAAQAADPAPFQKEIANVQSIIASGGVVDLAAAMQTLRSPAEMPVPRPMPVPQRIARALIALTPPLARTIVPEPASSSSPEAAAVGEMEWRIESLPAGTYELVLQYACPKLTAPLAIRVDFGNQKIETILDQSKTTSSDTAYRIFRLGRFTLPAEARGETLRLRAGDPGSSLLLVRQCVVARAKSSP